jgi:hypothetical protein
MKSSLGPGLPAVVGSAVARSEIIQREVEGLLDQVRILAEQLVSLRGQLTDQQRVEALLQETQIQNQQLQSEILAMRMQVKVLHDELASLREEVAQAEPPVIIPSSP